jgi:hypothetical protein
VTATLARPTAAPSRPARLRSPALGLFLLSPLVAEFLLGDLPLVLLFALVALAPMYGGGALLVREVARRRGLGWPGILLLALAYGVLEEGLVTQSLFNPDYADERLLDPGHVDWLGTGLPWALFVLMLHVLGSIGAPIAVVESLAGDRARHPWLGRRGLALVAVLFVAGCGVNAAVTQSLWPYTAPWYRLAGAAALAALLVTAALRRPTRPGPARGKAAPGARAVGLVGFGLASAYFGTILAIDALTPWGTVAAQVTLLVVAGTLLRRASRRPGWGGRQVLALAVAVLATYAWHAYTHLDLSVGGAVALAGDLLLDLGAVLLARAGSRRLPFASGRAG